MQSCGCCSGEANAKHLYTNQMSVFMCTCSVPSLLSKFLCGMQGRKGWGMQMLLRSRIIDQVLQHRSKACMVALLDLGPHLRFLVLPFDPRQAAAKPCCKAAILHLCWMWVNAQMYAWAFTLVWCAGERHKESVLQNIAVNLDAWTVQTKQETAIYHTLNKLSVDTSRKVGRVARLTSVCVC